MHYDLIIIGMGLSGLMAAKTAVDTGKKVLLVGKGMGALALFSNTIDVLGTFPQGQSWLRVCPDGCRIIPNILMGKWGWNTSSELSFLFHPCSLVLTPSCLKVTRTLTSSQRQEHSAPLTLFPIQCSQGPH